MTRRLILSFTCSVVESNYRARHVFDQLCPAPIYPRPTTFYDIPLSQLLNNVEAADLRYNEIQRATGQEHCAAVLDSIAVSLVCAQKSHKLLRWYLERRTPIQSGLLNDWTPTQTWMDIFCIEDLMSILHDFPWTIDWLRAEKNCSVFINNVLQADAHPTQQKIDIVKFFAQKCQSKITLQMWHDVMSCRELSQGHPHSLLELVKQCDIVPDMEYETPHMIEDMYCVWIRLSAFDVVLYWIQQEIHFLHESPLDLLLQPSLSPSSFNLHQVLKHCYHNRTNENHITNQEASDALCQLLHDGYIQFNDMKMGMDALASWFRFDPCHETIVECCLSLNNVEENVRVASCALMAGNWSLFMDICHSLDRNFQLTLPCSLYNTLLHGSIYFPCTPAVRLDMLRKLAACEYVMKRDAKGAKGVIGSYDAEYRSKCATVTAPNLFMFYEDTGCLLDSVHKFRHLTTDELVDFYTHFVEMGLADVEFHKYIYTKYKLACMCFVNNKWVATADYLQWIYDTRVYELIDKHTFKRVKVWRNDFEKTKTHFEIGRRIGHITQDKFYCRHQMRNSVGTSNRNEIAAIEMFITTEPDVFVPIFEEIAQHASVLVWSFDMLKLMCKYVPSITSNHIHTNAQSYAEMSMATRSYYVKTKRPESMLPDNAEHLAFILHNFAGPDTSPQTWKLILFEHACIKGRLDLVKYFLDYNTSLKIDFDLASDNICMYFQRFSAKK